MQLICELQLTRNKGQRLVDKIENSDVAEVFDNYPSHIRRKLMFLRQLVFDTASETEGVGVLDETLKWGEPSYLTKGGSTIRIDWKESRPDQYGIYFHCRTKLVDTFRELYGETFRFDGNRAILFNDDEQLPTDELKHCISLALTYHRQ